MPFDTCFIEHLHILGKPDKEFSQGTGMEHFGPSMTNQMKSDVSLGYCFGASINWLKLCLVQEKFATAIQHTHSGLVTSMAKTQLEVKKAGTAGNTKATQDLRQFYSEAQDEAYAKYQQEVRMLDEKFRNWLRRLGCTVHPDGSYSYRPALATKIETAEEAIEKAKVKAEREYDQDLKLAQSQMKLEKRKLDNARAGGFGRTWEALKKVGAGTYTGDVVPVIADDARWDSTIGKFLCRAVSTPAFKVGRGLVLGYKTGMDPSAAATIELPPGHAIALRRVAAGKYQMFDPNLGVYTYDSRAKLIYALILLLADGYNKRELDQEGDDWIVFCKTSDVIPEDPEWKVTNHEGLQAAWVEKDKVKSLMRSKIDQLVQTAYEKASLFVKIEDGINKAEQQLKANARKVGNAWQPSNPQGEKAFEVYNKLIEPSKKAWTECSKSCSAARVAVVRSGGTISINQNAVKRFVERGGKVEDSGLADLYNKLDRIA